MTNRARNAEVGDPDGLEDVFRAWLESDGFTCLGARSALRRGELTVRSYGRLGQPERTRDLHGDLVKFLLADGGPAARFRILRAQAARIVIENVSRALLVVAIEQHFHKLPQVARRHARSLV